MSRLSHFKIGLFVLICGGVGIAILLWIGAAQLLQTSKTYVTFFDESVQGLGPGSSVSYLGVQVGQVTSVDIAANQGLIRVQVGLRPGFHVDPSMAIWLAQAGITGQRYLEIGKAPPDIDKTTPTLDFPVHYPVIRSRPGQLTRIEEALKSLYTKVDAIDLQGFFAAWKQTGRDVDAILSGAGIQQSLRDLRAASKDLKEIMASLGKSGRTKEWGKSLEDLTATVSAARGASEALASQLQALPPDVFAQLAGRMDRMVRTGQSVVDSWDKQMGQSLVLFQEAVFQVNQVLTELKELVRSLREEPGRILNRPSRTEPFGR